MNIRRENVGGVAPMTELVAGTKADNENERSPEEMTPEFLLDRVNYIRAQIRKDTEVSLAFGKKTALALEEILEFSCSITWPSLKQRINKGEVPTPYIEQLLQWSEASDHQRQHVAAWAYEIIAIDLLTAVTGTKNHAKINQLTSEAIWNSGSEHSEHPDLWQ